MFYPMRTINMLSSADSIKGQGVGSAYQEQVALVKEGLQGKYEIYINAVKRCDIQHFHTINPEYLIALALEKRKNANVGYVHFLPETIEESLELPKSAKQIFYKYIISFYDAMDSLVTVNPYFIKELEKYGIKKEKISYIPNYVSETGFYKMCQKDIAALRKKWNIEENKFVVLSAGQVQTRKGVLDFIQTAKKLPHIQFVWAGGFSFGAMTDGYETLKKAMENPPKNVIFTGIIDREDMNGIYNMADMFFLPSFSELFPMTVLEAMAVGKPILLRDLDIYNDILFDYYAKASDVEGFCHIIQSLSQNKQCYHLYKLQSQKGHHFYSAENILKMWEGFYDKAYELCMQKREENKTEKTLEEIQKLKYSFLAEAEKLEQFKKEGKERISRLFGLIESRKKK